jgi:putative endonuclease
MYSVYILYSSATNRYYVGHTSDVQRRLREHNDGARLSRYTLKNGPWELVYGESDFVSRSEAMKREKQIKGWKSRKMIERLILS